MNTQISREELTAEIISIISGALKIDKENISPESKLISELNADSLDMLDIKFSIEQELGFRIDEHKIANKTGDGLTSREFKEKFTVADLIDFAEEKIKANVHADPAYYKYAEIKFK